MHQTVIPQFRMTDPARSRAFYVDGLGFSVNWEHRFEPDLPLFLSLTRAGQTIFLSEHAGDCEVGGAAYFDVPDVEACAAQFTANGIPLTMPLTDRPWGYREIIVTDPDGNRLRFGQEIHPTCD